MNKNRFCFKRIAVYSFCLGLALSLTACEAKYTGHGISYLSKSGGRVSLNVYDYQSENTYTEKIGNPEDIFWLTSSVYENESIAVDNKNTIYVMKKNGIETYHEIASNILEVKKMATDYLIIGEKDNSCYIERWDTSFHTRKDKIEVKGTYSASFLDEESIYFSVYDDKTYRFSKLYQYSFDEEEPVVRYKMDEAVHTIPFSYGDELYLIQNKKLTPADNIDLYELHQITDITSSKKLMKFEEPAKMVTPVGNRVYVLFGMNSTKVFELDMKNNSTKEIAGIQAEAAAGLYELAGGLYVITDRGVYRYHGGQIKRKTQLDNSLMNEFR